MSAIPGPIDFSRLTLLGREIRRGRGGNAALLLFESVDSTNALARRLVAALDSESRKVPSVDIVARRQTAGRGRSGRSWVSPRGMGIYATLLRDGGSGERLPLSPLTVAVALGEELNRYLGGRLRLKWPNDLVIDGKKLGGILIEATSRGAAGGLLAIGFGINYGQRQGDLPTLDATSLALEADRCPTLGELTGRLIGAVDRELRDASSSPVERYRSLMAHQRGDELRFRQHGEAIAGRFLGVDDGGRLELEVEGRLRRFAAGEVIES